MKFIFAFLIVIAGVYLLTWLLRLFQERFRGRGLRTSTRLQVSETFYMDAKTRVVLFQCDGQEYVSIITPQGASLVPHNPTASQKQVPYVD
jgi:flagellar biogenesis protein FliO